MYSKGLSFLLVVCVVGVCLAAEEIEHVHFVIHDTGYLFRSGDVDVEKDKSFSYTQLVSQMKSTIQSEGKETLPPSFYLVDFNLLNPDTSDNANIKAEVDYFAKHPDQGKIVQHRILGEQTNPFNIKNQTELIEKAKTFGNWSRDKLADFVEEIHRVVTTKTNPPTVALVHCICGCDRTGEVVGSYYMQYMGMTLHDAHALDKSIAGREISVSNYQALYWQCFYLKYGKGMNIDCTNP